MVFFLLTGRVPELVESPQRLKCFRNPIPASSKFHGRILPSGKYPCAILRRYAGGGASSDWPNGMLLLMVCFSFVSPSLGLGSIKSERIPKVPAFQNARDILAAGTDLFQFPQSELQGAATHHGLVQSEMLCCFDFVDGFHVMWWRGFSLLPPPELAGADGNNLQLRAGASVTRAPSSSSDSRRLGSRTRLRKRSLCSAAEPNSERKVLVIDDPVFPIPSPWV